MLSLNEFLLKKKKIEYLEFNSYCIKYADMDRIQRNCMF